MAARGWAQAQRVLCVRLDSLGDVLMTGPAIRAIADAVPGRSVTLLTSPAGEPAARLLPGVDDVIVYESPWMKSTPPRGPGRDFEMLARLNSARFDGAVIHTVSTQSALPAAMLCWLAGIPLRLAHCRENPYQLLTDWVRDVEGDAFERHEVRRQLDLVASVGFESSDDAMRIDLPPGAVTAARAWLDARGLHPGGFIVVHPGASAPSRRYPPAQFREVVDALAARGWRVVVAGGGSEAALVREVVGDTGGVTSAVGLDLPEYAALIAEAALLVSNNSGPVHLAAAVGTPVVDLYAMTNPQHTPWRVASRVLWADVACRWCYRSACPHDNACLAGVPASDVLAAIDSLTAERSLPGA